MSLDRPEFLWVLLGLVPVCFLYWRSWRHYKRFEATPAGRQVAASAPRWFRRVTAGLLFVGGLAAGGLALAEPVITRALAEPKWENVRLFVLFDVSLSMEYAHDVPPSRLAACKADLAALIDQTDGYEVAVIPFAGTPNLYYCPLTRSRQILKSLADRLGPSAAPSLGTDLTAVVADTVKMIAAEKLDTSGVNIILVVTDGGREEADAAGRLRLLDGVRGVKNGRVHCVGVGGDAPCPLMRLDAGGFAGYLREDGSDKPAASLLDEDVLKTVAAAGGGTYRRFAPGGLADAALPDLRQYRVAAGTETVYKKVRLSPYCLALAAACLWLVMALNRRH